MGHRLTKIYTRTGDDGQTGLGDGTRVAKDSLRVEAYGALDELNSSIGIVVADIEISTVIKDCLTRVQHLLFEIGGELCLPGYAAIKASHVQALEQILDDLNSELPPLKEFVLPGGHPAAANCHLARTICRRAERRVVSLAREADINQQGLIYLNRLSDLLFVIARTINKETSYPEPLWRHEKGKRN